MRIGVAETIVHTLLTDTLNKLKSDFPRVRFELAVDTSDAAGRRPGGRPARCGHPAARIRAPGRRSDVVQAGAAGLVLPGEHGIARPSPVAGGAGRATPLSPFPKGTLPFREIESRFSAPDIPRPSLNGSASLSTVKHLIGGGFGIGVLPVSMAETDDGQDRIKPIPVQDEALLSDLDFVISYFPERNREIGEAVVATARSFRSELIFKIDHIISQNDMLTRSSCFSTLSDSGKYRIDLCHQDRPVTAHRGPACLILSPVALRRAIRSGDFQGPTAGYAPGYLQGNLAILPKACADEFLQFCVRNPKPCP